MFPRSFSTQFFAPFPARERTPIPTNEGIVRRNRFRTTRNLASYKRVFGPLFEQNLSMLTENAHWLDAGAGECCAQLAYLREHPVPSKTAHCTAISYRPQDSTIEVVNDAPRARLFANRFFREISDQALTCRWGQFDMITDLFGILPYSADPSTILNRYLRLLKPGGTIYIHLKWLTTCRVAYEPLEKISLLEWLKEQKALNITHTPHGIRLTEKHPNTGWPIRIPHLTLSSTDTSSRPPYARIFVEDAPPPRNTLHATATGTSYYA